MMKNEGWWWLSRVGNRDEGMCGGGDSRWPIHQATRSQRKLMSGLDRLLVLTNRELVARRLVAFLFDGIRKRKLVYAGIATRLLGMLEIWVCCEAWWIAIWMLSEKRQAKDSWFPCNPSIVVLWFLFGRVVLAQKLLIGRFATLLNRYE